MIFTIPQPTAKITWMIFNNFGPVLVDIGASVRPPKIWDSLAKSSTYVGFDPDRREIQTSASGNFKKSIIINKAVVENERLKKVKFFFTKFPFCSSILKPDHASLANYIFFHYFQVIKTGIVPVTTLARVAKTLGLKSFDWIKIDTQGTDLRIIKSLPPNLRNQVLAIDIEPGLIDAYEQEDLFTASHEWMTKNGFWLSNLEVKGAARINSDGLKLASQLKIPFKKLWQRKSPGWCEARYFRTPQWLKDHDLPTEKYLLLWLFAMTDNQLGFTLDVISAYEKEFGKDTYSHHMRSLSKNKSRFSLFGLT